MIQEKRKCCNNLPRVVVPPEEAVPFVQLESLSTFVSIFCVLPFRLRVLYYSHEGFAQLHSPIYKEKMVKQTRKKNTSQHFT